MENKKILVVDDEKSIQKLFKEALSNAGYDVQTASSAEEALEIVKKTPYWLLFLDLNLPGINGVELGEKIHHEYPMAILIAVTGYASLFDLVGCRSVGFDDYFIKPVDLSDLVAAAEHSFKKLERWGKK